jgi:hypothetical protein
MMFRSVTAGTLLVAAVTLGGCAENRQSMAQLRYYCPLGYYLSYDYMCHQRSAPPSYVVPGPYYQSPISRGPVNTSQDWEREAVVAGGVVGAVEAGKYGLSKLRGAPAADDAAVARGIEEAAARAAPVAKAVPRIAAGGAALEMREGLGVVRGITLLDGLGDLLLLGLLL